MIKAYVGCRSPIKSGSGTTSSRISAGLILDALSLDSGDPAIGLVEDLEPSKAGAVEEPAQFDNMSKS